MHLILFLITVFNAKYNYQITSPSTYRVVQLIAVLLEVLNLCMIFNMLGTSVLNVQHLSTDTTTTQEFQFWLLIEILTIFTSVFTAMIYLSLRSAWFRD